MALTEKQARFVDEYMVDLNAAQAAVRAGYSPHSAKEIGHQNLGKPEVAAAIEAAQKARATRTGITADRVLTELAMLAFSNMGDYMRPGPDGDPYLSFADLTRAQTAALIEVTVDRYTDGHGDDAREIKRTKFKLADKRASLVDLGKHLGLFKERVEHTGKDGGPIETANLTPREVARKVAAFIADVQAQGTQDG